MSQTEIPFSLEQSIWQARFKAVGFSQLSSEEKAQVQTVRRLFYDDLSVASLAPKRGGGRLLRPVVEQLLRGAGRPPEVLVIFSSLMRDEDIAAANALWQRDEQAWKLRYYEPLRWVRQQVATAAWRWREPRGPLDGRAPRIGRSCRVSPYEIELWVEIYDSQEKRPSYKRQRSWWQPLHLSTMLAEWLGTNHPDVYKKLVDGEAQREMDQLYAEARAQQHAERRTRMARLHEDLFLAPAESEAQPAPALVEDAASAPVVTTPTDGTAFWDTLTASEQAEVAEAIGGVSHVATTSPDVMKRALQVRKLSVKASREFERVGRQGAGR